MNKSTNDLQYVKHNTPGCHRYYNFKQISSGACKEAARTSSECNIQRLPSLGWVMGRTLHTSWSGRVELGFGQDYIGCIKTPHTEGGDATEK